MKKLISYLTFYIVLMASSHVQAQYCGSSQVSFPSCGISGNYGFGDINTYPCITRGQFDTLIIPFTVYPQFSVGSSSATIVKLQFNSIDSLPCGLCWSSSVSNDPHNMPNEFNANESGCLKIAGLTNDPAGSYQLVVTLNVATSTQNDTAFNPISPIDSRAGNISIWIKVADPGACPDTVVMSNPAYSSCVTGISDISQSLTDLTIRPNPVSSDAKITFTTQRGGPEQITITNVIGAVVYSTIMMAKAGSNEMTINRNGMPAGIYILSIESTDGRANKKFIITE